MANYTLFKRYINIVVTPENGDPVVLTGLDAEFNVEKSIRSEPNKCELKIYNLSESNRSALKSHKRVKVDISAGYYGTLNSQNDIASLEKNFLIFHGDATVIYSTKNGPDWITTIATSDGLNAIQESRLNQSYKAGKVVKDITKDLVGKLLENTSQAVENVMAGESFQEGFDDAINHTYVSQGEVYKQLQSMFKKRDRSGFFLDGTFYVLKPTQYLGQTPINLETETGMVGSPEATNEGYIRVRSLIRPEFNPGYRVQLNSRDFKGIYRIERLTYNGSTFGNDWYAEIEAKPL